MTHDSKTDAGALLKLAETLRASATSGLNMAWTMNDVAYALESLRAPAPRPDAETARLRDLFADHYWDSFEGSKSLIMKHVDFVLSLTAAGSAEQPSANRGGEA